MMNRRSVLAASASIRRAFDRRSRAGDSGTPKIHLDTCEYIRGKSGLALIRLAGRFSAVESDRVVLLGVDGERYDPLPDGPHAATGEPGDWRAAFSIPVEFVEQRGLALLLAPGVVFPLPPLVERSLSGSTVRDSSARHSPGSPPPPGGLHQRVADTARDDISSAFAPQIRAELDDRDRQIQLLRASLEDRDKQIYALRESLDESDQQIESIRKAEGERAQALRDALESRKGIEDGLRTSLAASEEQLDRARNEVTLLRRRLARAVSAGDMPDAPKDDDWDALTRDLMERLRKAKKLSGTG